MEALNNILNRVSARNLKDPHPSEDEMQSIYKAALRAPDHAWLRPSSFIEVKGSGISRLSKIFEDYADTVENLKEEIKEKYIENGSPMRLGSLSRPSASFKPAWGGACRAPQTPCKFRGGSPLKFPQGRHAGLGRPRWHTHLAVLALS